MAADEAVARTDLLREKLPRLIGWLRFAPAVMVVVAGASFGFRQLHSPSEERPPVAAATPVSPPASTSSPLAAPAPVRPETARPVKPAYVLPEIKMPDDLKQLSNADVRALSYTIDSDVASFYENYIHRLVEIEEKDKDDGGQKANDVRLLDDQINRDIRSNFIFPVMKVQRELIRRLNDKAEKIREFPAGILNGLDLKGAAYRLVSLANKLP